MTDYTDEELQEMHRRRQENIRLRDAFFQSLDDDADFAEALKNINSFKLTGPVTPKPPPRPKNPRKDPSFRFSGHIPKDRRLSGRIRKLPPQFSYADLPNEVAVSLKRKRSGINTDLDHIEDIVYAPKKRRAFSVGYSSRTRIIPVEEVTEEMLSNITFQSSKKVYDQDNGTSCHQCRQKTRDTKTCCRNVNCIGIRGQYCGACMKNRYGEDSAVALLDPDWFCFVCRGTCNCSFCRIKKGKLPTGVLAPTVQKQGFDSVQEYLEYVRSKKEPDAVLGFDIDFAYMIDGTKFALKREYQSSEELKKERAEKERAEIERAEKANIKQDIKNGDDDKAETKTSEDEVNENDRRSSKIRVSTSLFEKKHKEKKQKRKSSLIGFSADLSQAIFDNGVKYNLFGYLEINPKEEK